MNIGDKVVCVSDTPCDCCGESITKAGVRLNSVYAVRGVEYEDGKLWLKLVGIKFSDGIHDDDLLDSCDFRKLDEVKSTASKLHEINPEIV